MRNRLSKLFAAVAIMTAIVLPGSAAASPSPAVLGIGNFWMVNQVTGRCIDVPAWSTEEGRALDQWGCVYQANEYWTPNDIGGWRYQFINAHSSMCLNVKHNSLREGAPIIQWRCGDADNSLFFPVEYGNNGWHKFFNVASLGLEHPLCIAPVRPNSANGLALVQYRCDSGHQVLWKLAHGPYSSIDFRISV